MNNETQNRVVKVSISLPMDFPEDWDDKMINFSLNDSSWCWSNIIDELENYAESHNGCICDICSGVVMSKEEQDIRDKFNMKPFNKILPNCPNCSNLNNCKEYLKDPDIVVKCIWYGWLKDNNFCNDGC